MKLTRKKAIELCIDVWTWCARTGKDKSEWPRWEKYENYNLPQGSQTQHECWFCEYGFQRKKLNQKGERCDYCPHKKKQGVNCYEDSDRQQSYYSLWEDATTPKDRKKYAKLFLGQIKSIEQQD